VTPTAFNDGMWHHVVATQGADGMRLYVDGIQRGTNPTTSGQAYTGYWRAGGDRCFSGATSSYFAGALDEVAVYPRVLPPTDVAAHFTAGGGVAANQPPTAAFASATTALEVELDASDSADPDGTVETYEWDFGDGATGTGLTTSHTFAAAGDYDVTLTVTDDLGSTAKTTVEVTVVRDPSVARDAFERSVTGGWGTADRGGAWTLTGALSRYSVVAGAASVSLGAGSGAQPTLRSVSTTDVDLSAVLTTDKAPTGGGQYVSLVGRAVSGGSEYRAKLHLASTGAAAAHLTRVDAGAETSLGGAVVPGLTYAPGTRLRVRFQAVGGSPTTLRVKVWLQDQAEPTGWLLTRTDSAVALQAAGSVGLHQYLSGSATNAPVVFTVDDLWVGPPQP
jgi:PKD repeat protein